MNFYKSILLRLIFCFSIYLTSSYAILGQEYLWAQSVPSSSQGNIANSTAIGLNSEVYVSGLYGDTAIFNPGGLNFILSKPSNGMSNGYLARYSVKGEFRWAFSLGNNYSISAVSAIDIGNKGDIFLGGDFHDSIDCDPSQGIYTIYGDSILNNTVIARYDSLSNLIWAGSVKFSTLKDLQCDYSSNLIFGGSFFGSTDMDISGNNYTLTTVSGVSEGYLTKYAQTGQLKWAINTRCITGSSECMVNSIELGELGAIYLGGNFKGDVDFDPSNSNIILTSKGDYDVFIAKYDSSGSLLWVNSFGGSSLDVLEAMDIDKDDNIYLTGRYNGIVDFNPGPDTLEYNSNLAGRSYITSFNQYGGHRWAKIFLRSSSPGHAESIQITAKYEVIVTGGFRNTADFDPSTEIYSLTATGIQYSDIFLAKYDSVGSFKTAFKIGNYSGDIGMEISIIDTNNILIAGSFSGNNVDFNPGWGEAFFSGPSGSSFIAKYGPCPTYEVSIKDTICEGEKYIFPDGKFSYTSVTDTSVISSSGGCDSMIITALYVRDVKEHVVFENGKLKAAATGGQYQWLSCDSLGYSAIPGENGPEFTPTTNGRYALQVTENACTDTSDCLVITWVGMDELPGAGDLVLFPIPASDYLQVSSPINLVEYRIFNLQGVRLKQGNIREQKIDVSDLQNGMYLLELSDGKNWVRRKFLVRR